MVYHDAYCNGTLQNRTGSGSTRHEIVGQSEGLERAGILASADYLTTMIAIAVIYSVKARPPVPTWSGVLALPRNPPARISRSSYSCTCGAKDAYASI